MRKPAAHRIIQTPGCVSADRRARRAAAGTGCGRGQCGQSCPRRRLVGGHAGNLVDRLHAHGSVAPEGGSHQGVRRRRHDARCHGRRKSGCRNCFRRRDGGRADPPVRSSGHRGRAGHRRHRGARTDARCGNSAGAVGWWRSARRRRSRDQAAQPRHPGHRGAGGGRCCVAGFAGPGRPRQGDVDEHDG